MASREELLRRLAQRIRDIEASERPHFHDAVSLGIAGLEQALPEGRLPAGSLVELLAAAEGAGAWTLALMMARHACGAGKALVVADPARRFYPPAAARLGVDLRRTIVIRPRDPRYTLAAITHSLRCAAVGAVLGAFDNLPTFDFRRLQLAAELGGGIGFLLRPATALRVPSFAAMRLRVAPLVSADAHRRIQVDVVRLRGGKSGQSLLIEVDHETGDVRVSAALAPATTPARRPRLSG